MMTAMFFSYVLSIAFKMTAFDYELNWLDKKKKCL